MDIQQYEEVFQQYADDVYRACVFHLNDKEKAKNMVEQVFLKLYQNADQVCADYMLGYLLSEVRRLTQEELGVNLAR